MVTKTYNILVVIFPQEGYGHEWTMQAACVEVVEIESRRKLAAMFKAPRLWLREQSKGYYVFGLGIKSIGSIDIVEVNVRVD